MATDHQDDINDFILPKNLEAEQAVLGAILLDPNLLDQSLIKLKSNEFFSAQHRKIYKGMEQLAKADIPVDLITLVSHLKDNGWLAEVGNVSYLYDLSHAVPTTANIMIYIDIVKEKYIQRQMVRVAEELSRSGYETEDVTQSISATQTKLEGLITGNSIRKEIRKIGEILLECFDDIEGKYKNRDGTGVTGTSSGYDDLDWITGGFQDSDLIIVGARPSVGKTAFGLNIARNAAKEGKSVAVFSLEMSEKQLVNRMICAESNIDASRIRTGHLLDDDWEKLTMAIGSLNDYPIFIDDTPDSTIMEIRSKCRKLKKDFNLGMIVIDYLQLIEFIHRNGVNRQQEITEISRSLKQMAKELNVPVIALSQLSRGVEQRQDKRPMMSDLRESGSIEQDADIVAFLYRDDYYNQDSEKKNIIEIIIAKQRNGPVGTVELVFLKNYNKFVNLERTYEKTEAEANYKKPDMYR